MGGIILIIVLAVIWEAWRAFKKNLNAEERQKEAEEKRIREYKETINKSDVKKALWEERVRELNLDIDKAIYVLYCDDDGEAAFYKYLSLIRRLRQFCSRHQAAELNRQLLTVNVKSKNEQTLYNVDTIYKAIAADCQISFKYVDHVDSEGKKHYRYGGKVYTASPFQLIYTDDEYYLLTYNSEKNRTEHRRVDRMENVRVLDDHPRDGLEVMKDIDVHDYTRYTFGMSRQRFPLQ